MHVLGNANILYLLFFLLIIASLSGCSSKCYDAGQTSSSGTVSLEIPAVTDGDSSTNGWIKSDIEMKGDKEYPVTVMGFVNVCPPIDSSDCSIGSDFCRKGAFYPMRCDNSISNNGANVKLDDKGNMVCSGSQVLSDSSFVFDIPAYSGDSIVIELMPLVDTAVSQQYSTSEVSCSCLSDGSCNIATQDFIFYTPDYINKSGHKILYKAIAEGVDANGNPKLPKCSDTPLTKEDIMQICGYGDYFCILEKGKKQPYYVSSLVAGGRQKLWYSSHFGATSSDPIGAVHMPNFLAAGDSSDVNGGLLINYRAGDLRGAGYADSGASNGFTCADLAGGKKYNKQFSFYEANKICSNKIIIPNTKFSISGSSGDVIALPGTIYLDASDSSGYEKVSKLIAKGYSNFWIPSIALNYHNSQPTSLNAAGTQFAPISSDTGDYIGYGYPYKIPGSGGKKWISVTANSSSSFKAKRGGIQIRIKRYCLHENGQNLYANINYEYPDHKPGEDPTDIEMIVKTSVDASGIMQTEPVVIPSGTTGTVYFGIKDAKIGSAAEVASAKADNNVYVIMYDQRKWPTTISKPINALIDFVKKQLFGTSFSSTDDPGIIAPMYEVFAQKLYPLFAYGLTLYVSIYGIMWMSGMTRNIQQDLVITVIKVAFVAACLGTDSWNFLAYNLYTFFVEGVTEILDSTVDSIVYVKTDFSFLDKTIGTLFDWTVILRLFSLILAGPVGFIVFIIIVHGLVAYSGAMFRFVLRYVMIIFAYGWLIFLAPLFILCLLFPLTKEMFNNWLKLLVNFALQPLFMFTLVGMLNEVMLYSINKMLMFGICGNECVLYIKLGELGGQNVGFCLFSFFLPQGYDAAIPAAQYLTSATDPMTNFFGLPFGLTIIFLFYLATYCVGAFMNIAEMMAQTISSSMGSVTLAVNSAEEGLKWLIGEDRATQGRIHTALRGNKDRKRDERSIETDDLEDDAALNRTNRAPRQPIRSPESVSSESDDMEPRVMEGNVQGDREEVPLQETPPQPQSEMPEKEEPIAQKEEAIPEPQEEPMAQKEEAIPESQEEPIAQKEEAIPESQEEPIAQKEEAIPEPQEEELSELEKKFREWGDEYHDVGHLKEHADDASLEGSQTTDSLATEQVRESDYEDPVMKAIAERKAAEPQEEELSELEKKFREWGDEYHDVGHLKEHADDASLEGSQTTDSLATEQVRESDYEDPVMKAIAERKAAEPQEEELSELEKKFREMRNKHNDEESPEKYTNGVSSEAEHRTKEEDDDER
ncbi:hypothetical protein GUI12_04665 [Anaplasmataceae bacterium AB001_6]|nr:hypothetical protein GUI12_04665 [Anaplasmataceae bacterium AB001_6]